MREGITVVVPTLGRATLTQTLDSLALQVNPEDCVIVVSEGHDKDVLNLVGDFAQSSIGEEWRYEFDIGGNWGHTNRNRMFDTVETSHVWTIDDDDVAAPHAMDALRAHMDDPWTVFKMTFGENSHAKGITCWRWPQITDGDIGTPMIFAPLTDCRFGLEYRGDLKYAQALEALLGKPFWADEVVAIIRP